MSGCGVRRLWVYMIHYVCQFLLYIRDCNPWIFSLVDLMTLFMSSLIRGSGIMIVLSSGRHAKNLSACRRPIKPLELYDLHSSPYCGRVRQTLQYLDLDHIIYPCPKESFKQHGICINSRYRPKAKKIGGKCQFPLLVDPNKSTTTSGGGGGNDTTSGSCYGDPTTTTPTTTTTPSTSGLVIYESKEIISYLWREYGDKASSSMLYKLIGADGRYNLYQEMIGVLCRPCLHMGIFRAPSRQPDQPLELVGWGDGNPFCLKVEETLATLELPYKFRSPNFDLGEGRMCCKKLGCKCNMPGHLILKKIILPIFSQPILKDPNSGIELKNSSAIVKYLQNTYQTAPVPAEQWLDYTEPTL